MKHEEKLIEKENLLSTNVERKKIVTYLSNLSLLSQSNIFRNEKILDCFALKSCFTNCRMQQAPILWGGRLFKEGA